MNKVEYILINNSNIEPLSLNEVKSHLRLDGNSSFDNQLSNLIKVAREYCEQVTGRDLINKTYRALMDCLPNKLKIEKSKLQSITSIKYYSNSILQTLPTDKYYITQSNDYSCLIVNNDVELNIDDREQAVNIDFIAGYGENADSVPQGLKQAMLSYITYLFQNAGDCAEEGQFQNLFANYKIPENMVFFI
jgi:uncharacterized phiE125 gp8 family phage protein